MENRGNTAFSFKNFSPAPGLPDTSRIVVSRGLGLYIHCVFFSVFGGYVKTVFELEVCHCDRNLLSRCQKDVILWGGVNTQLATGILVVLFFIIIII